MTTYIFLLVLVWCLMDMRNNYLNNKARNTGFCIACDRKIDFRKEKEIFYNGSCEVHVCYDCLPDWIKETQEKKITPLYKNGVKTK